jgi:LysR family transcriptional regulator, transcriptional activator of nhaA
MEWLNYHHLFYFWTVCREGSISRAADKLRLAQPTVSGQIKVLEEAIGERLFEREGRGLQLTEMGRTVQRYADEIFLLGRELQDVIKGRPTGRPVRLSVGIAGMVPKLLSHQLLEAALKLPEPVRLFCCEDSAEPLLAKLAIHDLDLVLSDVPAPPSARVKVFSHLLGECGVSIFATPELATRYRRGFPRTLTDAPFLLPAAGTALRRSLDEWFEQHDLEPRVVAEFDDSALMKAFGQGGLGLFAAPSVAEPEIIRQYGVKLVGRAEDVRERFYAISVERTLKHPAVLAITTAARRVLFQEAPASSSPLS